MLYDRRFETRSENTLAAVENIETVGQNGDFFHQNQLGIYWLVISFVGNKFVTSWRRVTDHLRTHYAERAMEPMKQKCEVPLTGE